MISMKKTEIFLSPGGKSSAPGGTAALLEQSLDTHIHYFEVFQRALFLIYRERMSLNDSGYDSPFLKKSQSQHMAASADECLEEDDSKSVR